MHTLLYCLSPHGHWAQSCNILINIDAKTDVCLYFDCLLISIDTVDQLKYCHLSTMNTIDILKYW